ncbi:MAG TPA: acetyl-CoA carboxylase biotin carboxyl carrier protein, partial [Candidatus Merdibacter merdigallinarum]|nr:acetyl-CoA carboxylase biotin carboxyl carrier protein [Candidatus Merdibacter merdigallinarum]
PLSVERVEQPQPKPVEHAAEIAEGDAVRSPLVGTFYAAASENAKPFVEIGQTVKQGDILCIIEAMKVMNEIHAPRSGVIREILVQDGAMVQFDEELMIIGE